MRPSLLLLLALLLSACMAAPPTLVPLPDPPVVQIMTISTEPGTLDLVYDFSSREQHSARVDSRGGLVIRATFQTRFTSADNTPRYFKVTVANDSGVVATRGGSEIVLSSGEIIERRLRFNSTAPGGRSRHPIRVEVCTTPIVPSPTTPCTGWIDVPFRSSARGESQSPAPALIVENGVGTAKFGSNRNRPDDDDPFIGE